QVFGTSRGVGYGATQRPPLAGRNPSLAIQRNAPRGCPEACPVHGRVLPASLQAGL
ncbi:hypothetical protein EV182_001781, partial [Spiromyces aspiralis]